MAFSMMEKKMSMCDKFTQKKIYIYKEKRQKGKMRHYFKIEELLTK